MWGQQKKLKTPKPKAVKIPKPKFPKMSKSKGFGFPMGQRQGKNTLPLAGLFD